MKLEPTLNRIIVRPNAAGKKENAAGLIIVESTKDGRPELGTVVAAGPGKFHPKTGERVPMASAVGDTVLFSKMSGQVITLGEQEVVSLFEDDIVGIIRQ